jgi:hypothetical protein
LIAYTEESIITLERKYYAIAGLVAITLYFGYEISRYFTQNYFSTMGIGYSILFYILWGWKCLPKYTYTLTDTEMIFITDYKFFVLKKVVKLEDIESFSNNYIKKFFKKTKISRYYYRYNFTDGRPERLIAFKRNNKLAGIIFKCSDKMIKKLQEKMPERFIKF